VAVKLRLMRMGKTKQPTYRVVAADSRSPRDGRFIEILGVYAPRGRSTSNPDAVVEINNDKALKWLRQGALPTDRVERLLKQSGAWEEFNAGKAGGSPVAAVKSPTPEPAAPAAGAVVAGAVAAGAAATEEAGGETPGGASE
jgi:small subunit ribosomal protein S16